MARLESLQSSQVTAVASLILIPSQVKNLIFTVEQGKVVLNWDAVTLNSDNITPITDLAGYKIYRKKESDDSYAVEIGSTAPGEITFTDTSMFDGASYVYAVSAYDTDANEGVKSEDLDVKTIPSVPTGLTSSVLKGSITLTWSSIKDELEASKNENLAGFAIHRVAKTEKPGGLLEWIADVPLEESNEVLKYVDTDVKAGNEYTYAITAYDDTI